MHIIFTILIGLVIGLVARLALPGKDSAGFIVTVIVGIVGSLVGTFLGQALGLYQPGEIAGFVMSVIGAMLVLFTYRKFSKPN